MKSVPSWRLRLQRFVGDPRLERWVMGLIVLNAIVLGLETVPQAMQAAGTTLVRLDRILLGLFVVELVLRLVAKGRHFFRDPWCVFDFVVVAIALVPAAGPLAVLRSLRVLRVLRLATAVPSMRRVVAGLLGALPGLGAIAGLMVIIYYVASVVATKLFASTFPDWFGSIPASAYSLFQIMTLESWSMGIVRPVMEVHPWAWTFFVPYILLATFTMLNLFIGVIVSALQHETQAESKALERHMDEKVETETNVVVTELAALRREVGALRAALERRDPDKPPA